MINRNRAASANQRWSMKILRPEEVKVMPQPRDLTPEELAEAYRLAKEAFTADDLQRFTEIEEGTPVEQILAEMEAAQKRYDEQPRA